MRRLHQAPAWVYGGLFVLLTALTWTWVGRADRAAHQPRLNEAYGRIPLHFEANQGQTDERVKFVTRGRGYSMFLTANEAVLALGRADARDRRDPGLAPLHPQQRAVNRTVLRMAYAGANQKPRVVGQDELPGKANYFIGSDPAKWRTNVPTFARVRYEQLYAGIDLVFYGNQRALEYDFVVRPGADPSDIALDFDGVDRLEIDAHGDLLLHAAHGVIRQRKPRIYQDAGGVRREIPGGYVLQERDRVRFELAAYDTSQTLVIDPELFYSTLLGGTDDEEVGGVAVDAGGNAHVAGDTMSADFPTTIPPSHTPSPGLSDVFVTKLNATGSALLYSTYFGGSFGDDGHDLALDVAGNAYVTGRTSSSDFPVTAGSAPGVFVVKLNPGGGLVYSFGFSVGLGTGRSIAVDAAGNAYVTGDSAFGVTGTPGAFQPLPAGSSEAFVLKVDSLGMTLLYATNLGGSGQDIGSGIAIDAAGNAYVAGLTNSANFPVSLGAFQIAFGGGSLDGFVTKVNALGSGVLYSTYLGGTGFDACRSVGVDTAEAAYVVGATNSANFPTIAGAFQASVAGLDSFVTKLNPIGTGLVYSSYFGGSGSEDGRDIAVDMDGNAYIAGGTDSIDLPTTPAAFQTGLAGPRDAFVAKLDASASALVYSSYLGGTGDDVGSAIALDDLFEPNAYVIGLTESTDFPTTTGAFQTTHAGLRDAFVAEVIDDVVLPPGPTAGRVTGHGEIAVGAGEKGRFHIIAERLADGTVGGKVKYRNYATGASMKSDTITEVMISGNTAHIEGTCGILCTFTVDVSDVDDTGANDTFSISWPGGSDSGTLQKGDIQIQQ